jgi:UDP-glucose 4-epimerase
MIERMAMPGAGKNVVITGAAGAIGREVVSSIRDMGHKPIGLGHGISAEFCQEYGWINGEVNGENLSQIGTHHGTIHGIIHLAGGSSVGPSLVSPVEDFNRTVTTAVRLLDWVRQFSIETSIVFASSAAVYGDGYQDLIQESSALNPKSPYGAHKAMMEAAAKTFASSFGVRSTIVRLFSVYGPGLRKQLIWEICSKLLQGQRNIKLGGSGDERRDWLHISDAARFLTYGLDLASTDAPILNGCTGEGLTIYETVKQLLLGQDLDIPISFSGDARPGDPRSLVGDPSLGISLGFHALVRPRAGLTAFARSVVGFQ